MRQRGTIALCFAFAACIFLSIPPPTASAVSVEMGPFELSLKPGQEYLGFITATNEKPKSATLKIYLGDWMQTDDGEQFPDAGTQPRSIADWMQIYPNQVTLPAGASERIYFQVKVPDDPNLSGSYWGIFFVEGEPSADEDNLARGEKANIGMNIIVRHGIKVYVTIPNTEERKAAFVAAWTEQGKEGGLNFISTFENQGNTYLRPTIWLELRDWTGSVVYTQQYKTLSVLPGIKRDCTFELKGLNIPRGRYIGLIIADYGAMNLIAAQAEIEVT